MTHVQESHSDETERAIFRMHQRGDDVKAIINKLQNCEIHVSRKYVNLAIKRGNHLLFSNRYSTPLASGNSGCMEELVEEQAVIEEEMDETENPDDEMDNSSEVDPSESVVLPVSQESEEISDETEAVDHPEITTIKSEAPEYVSFVSKKPRRIKTTEELIKRIEEDFRRYPEEKVKDRAAKFGIAVGTLCQIKHNVLKMPKESGRTWKSTPQMVEAVKADIETDPNMKVKERAEKFNISVGTLCRIMHDMLQRPKRTVNRSPEKRAPRRKEDSQESPGGSSSKGSRKRARRYPVPNESSLDSSNLDNSPPSMLNSISFSSEKEAKDSQVGKVCQLQLKGSNGSQVLVLTFDPSSNTAQFANVNGGSPEDVIWVVNPSTPPDTASTSSK